MLGAAFCCVFAADSDDSSAAATYDAEGASTYCAVESSFVVTVTGDKDYYVVGDIIKNGIVDSTKKTHINSTTLTGELTFTTPKESGNCTINVRFYEDDDYTQLVGEKNLPLKVVDPIVLTFTLTNNSSVDMEVSYYFKINGVKAEDSASHADVAAGSTATATYKYVTDNVRDTTYSLETDDQFSSDVVSGFGVEKKFYANDNDYTLTTVLCVIVLIIVAIVGIYIYRKPVVNKGKPKGRR